MRRVIYFSVFLMIGLLLCSPIANAQGLQPTKAVPMEKIEPIPQVENLEFYPIRPPEGDPRTFTQSSRLREWKEQKWVVEYVSVPDGPPRQGCRQCSGWMDESRYGEWRDACGYIHFGWHTVRVWGTWTESCSYQPMKIVKKGRWVEVKRSKIEYGWIPVKGTG